MIHCSKLLNLRGSWEPLNSEPISQQCRWRRDARSVAGIGSEPSLLGETEPFNLWGLTLGSSCQDWIAVHLAGAEMSTHASGSKPGISGGGWCREQEVWGYKNIRGHIYYEGINEAWALGLSLYKSLPRLWEGPSLCIHMVRYFDRTCKSKTFLYCLF